MDRRWQVAMQLMIACIVVLVASVHSRNLQKDVYFTEGEYCALPGGAPGVCTKLSGCLEVARNMTQKIFSHERCGFIGFEEVVCCGASANLIQERIGVKSDEKCEEYKTIMENFLVTYIIRGEEVSEGEFPHMAALGFQSKSGNVSWNCGGTLISERYVLTAAHCVRTKQFGEPKFVRLGYIDMQSNEVGNGEQLGVENAVVHPNYTTDNNYFDIALLRLSKPVSLTEYKFPACLYTKQQEPQSGLLVTGWGDTNGDGISSSRYLLKAELQPVTNEKCQRIYKKPQRLRNGIVADMLCAENPVKRSDTCKGDSGGPMQVKNGDIYSIVGVTSFGPIQCGGPTPGVYSRVTSYLPWIESIVWQ